jgi:hypothetical protein
MAKPRRSYRTVPSVKTLGFTILSCSRVWGRVTVDCIGKSKTSAVDAGARDVEEVAMDPAADPLDVEDLRETGSGAPCYSVENCHVSSAEDTPGALEIGSNS